ncbi:MAG: hypothetical protein QOF36_1807 [Microbacteriaceae bacterium]|nr:hypothetical protein [Microbacteriaceae bacterium]
MRVHDLAFVRSGDKGDVCNVAVMARHEEGYRLLKLALLPERIEEQFAGLVEGPIAVYLLPNLHAFEVVMHRALGGGATRTLRFDQTGKSMCAVLARMVVPPAP